jgi:hypothetical protein
MKLAEYLPVQHDDFWTHDTPMFVGKFPYYRNEPRMVQARLHVSDEKFRYEKHEIIPLNMKSGDSGKRTYVMMHPYILEPELFMTVGLYPKPKHYSDQDDSVGEVLSTQVKGMRQNQVGNAQAWYYPQDRVIVLWECFLNAHMRNVKSLIEDLYMPKLWRTFEQWLIKQFPEATHIATPFNDPIAISIEEYQTFLRSLGYQSIAPAAFGKEIYKN